MPKALCSDAEFIELFKLHGTSGTAKILGLDRRNVQQRRDRIELRNDTLLVNPNAKQSIDKYPARVPIDLKDGIAIIGSDAHYWPDLISTAHRGIVKLAKELKPKVFCLNGDVVDGASISRHPPLGWSHKPKVNEELNACLERTDEIESAARGAKLIWTLGNHDARFDMRLAQQNHDFEGVKGFTLRDHFPKWQLAVSAWINDLVVVKHRFKGGIHATHNNALWAGKTVVTGHLHSLKVTPFNDYNGTRFGVDTGTLADPYGEQFEYTEDNPLNHRSGFVVLTFSKGKLLWPEIAAVIDDDHIQFRGDVIRV